MRRKNIDKAEKERNRLEFKVGFLCALAVFGGICAVLLLVLML